MSVIKDKNYIQTYGWMINNLDLKQSELKIYSIIYGFCKSDEGKFIGSISYLQEWGGYTKATIVNVLKSLVDKGLIFKKYVTINNVNRCEYTVNFNYTVNGEKVIPQPGNKPNNSSKIGGKVSIPPNEKNSSDGIEIKHNIYNNTSYYSNTSYYHTSYDNTREKNNTRKPEPSVQSDRAVAKTLKLNNKTKNRVNSVLAYIQKRNVNQRVYSLFIDYLTSLVELNREFSFKSMQKQIDALLELTVEQQIKALNETIIKGWRSLKYSVDNIKNMAASPNKNDYVKPIAKQQYTEEEKKQILERCKNQPTY